MSWTAILWAFLGGGAFFALLAGVLASAVKFLVKRYTEQQFQKNIEQFRSELELDRHRQSEVFAALHTKRADLIAELHSKLLDLQSGVGALRLAGKLRSIREEHATKYQAGSHEPGELLPEVDTLTDREVEQIREAQQHAIVFDDYFRRHRIYFPEPLCSGIDSLHTQAFAAACAYENLAIKDEDGESLVHPDVQNAWDRANEQIPILLTAIEKEFRSILGMENQSADER